MKKTSKTSVLSLSILFCFVFLFQSYGAQTHWQVTRDGWSSGGECVLESNKISVTVHQYYVNVVEEAVISTRGEVRSGDSETLEIYGDFTLSEGASLRSMLLWHGDNILKAKLRKRAEADSAYEEVVDREEIVDPALIAYNGNNSYSFKIYPVSINNSRKIRILYTIPLKVFEESLQFKVQSAFTAGPSSNLSEIPVEFRRGEDLNTPYIIEYNNTKKSIRFGSTYLLPYSALASESSSNSSTGTQKPITLTPDTRFEDQAFSTEITEGQKQGHYYTVYYNPPDTVKEAVELMVGDYTLEVRLSSGGQEYLRDITDMGYVRMLIKSGEVWNNEIHWTIYDYEGRVSFEYTQEIPVDTSSAGDMAPLLWASKHSIEEERGSFGALYGFVDSDMSLLALERDLLDSELVPEYREWGVPQLTEEDIEVDPNEYTDASDDIVTEDGSINTSTSLKRNDTKSVESLTVTALSDKTLEFKSPEQLNGNAVVTVFDLKGRKVFATENFSIQGTSSKLSLPKHLKGMYIVRVNIKGRNLTRKIILK